MKPKFKTLVCKAETDGAGTVSAIASTPDVDRYGDVVAPSWDLEAFKANPVIMHGHDYDGPVVGKATEIDLVGESLMMSVQFDESDTNPVGQRIANQFRSGFMSAFSVGFSPGKATPRTALPKDHPAYIEKGAGQYFEQNQLLEVSAVAIPANPHALAVRAKRWGLEAENKHVINVEETEDSVIVTYARHEMEAPEPEAEPEAAPEVEEDRYGYDDEDEDKAETLRSIVRAELLALIGNQNDQPVQDAIDWFEDSQTANRSEDFAALFNEAE
tara:strand:+ start:2199 stop:3014 length:816 start_codon:yes stop_codon:yes gene_type:complete